MSRITDWFNAKPEVKNLNFKFVINCYTSRGALARTRNSSMGNCMESVTIEMAIYAFK